MNGILIKNNYREIGEQGMIIWVKEIPDKMTVKSVSVWTKPSIEIRPLIGLESIQYGDYIIISKTDMDFNFFEPFSLCSVLVYEDFFHKISNNVIVEISYNFDYYYLKNAISASKREEIDTIITGSSYGLFGIDCKQLPGAVNLALRSQDLYYSLKGIYEVCSANKNIRNIVLCCNYYYFFSDLSKTKNEDEIQRVSKVYQPLYEDLHNCELLPPKVNILPLSDIFDIERVVELYSFGEYEKAYFNKDRTRNSCAARVWEDKSKDWHQLNETEKVQAGIARAESHNKSYKWKISLDENKRLFNQLSVFCDSCGINLVLVVTPATSYYREHLYQEFKDDFFEVLNQAEGMIHLLDLYEDARFEEEDFNDTDHLSDSGAAKLTSAVRELLLGIN